MSSSPRDPVSNRAGGLHSARVRQPTLGRTRKQARPPPPPPPAVGASFSGARFSLSFRFHHPRSNLCHPVRARPQRSGPPPPSGAKHLRSATRSAGHAPSFSRPTSRHPVTHGALPLHRPPRRPNSPSARPPIGPDARRSAGPLTTTTHKTPEPGYPTLSSASDARLAVLPELTHHLLHGPHRRHSIRI
jgi:hypothetical protein